MDNPTDSQKTLEDILDDAIDLTNNQHSYVNNIRFRVTNNEVILDLYLLASDPQNGAGEPIAYRSHRVILPLGLAKNIGELLVSGTKNWEEKTGVTLPIQPQDIDKGNSNGDS